MSNFYNTHLNKLIERERGHYNKTNRHVNPIQFHTRGDEGATEVEYYAIRQLRE